MKKKFIEPEIKRIELNLNENIASSNPEYTVVDFLKVSHGFTGCMNKTQDLNIRPEEIDTFQEYMDVWPCFVNNPGVEGARLLGIDVPY